MALPVEEQQLAQHAVQSIVWQEAGEERISLIIMIVAFIERQAVINCLSSRKM